MNGVTPFAPTESTRVADRIHQMPFADMFFIEPNRADDFRGFYAETALIPDLESALGYAFSVKQLNHARSEVNVARGFHAESWNKLITVIHGSCYCVWVDVRQTSPTFGQSVSLQLGDGQDSTYATIYVPKGIANGYVVTNGPADYSYATDALYRDRDPQFDTAISLFDNELNINWPVPRMNMILSQRDKQAMSLAQLREKGMHQ